MIKNILSKIKFKNPSNQILYIVLKLILNIISHLIAKCIFKLIEVSI